MGANRDAEGEQVTDGVTDTEFLSAGTWIRSAVVGLVLAFAFSRAVGNLGSVTAVSVAALVGYPLYRAVKWGLVVGNGDPSKTPPSSESVRSPATLMVAAAAFPLVVLVPASVLGESGGDAAPGSVPEAFLILTLFASISLAFHLVGRLHRRHMAANGVEPVPMAVDIGARLPAAVYFAGLGAANNGVPGFETSLLAMPLFGQPAYLWGTHASLALIFVYGLVLLSNVGAFDRPSSSPDEYGFRTRWRSRSSAATDGGESGGDGSSSDTASVTSIGSSGSPNRDTEPADTDSESSTRTDASTPRLPENVADALPRQTLKHGVVVTKDHHDEVDTVDDMDDPVGVSFAVENGNREEATVGIVDSLPASIRADECKALPVDGAEWGCDPGRNEVGVRLTLDPDERRDVHYLAEVPTRHAAAELFSRAPRIQRMDDTVSDSDAGPSERDSRRPGEASAEDDPETGGRDTAPADEGVDDQSSAADGTTPVTRRTGAAGSNDRAVDTDHEYLDPPPELDFGDVAGMHDLKRRLEADVIEPFVDPKYERYDIGKVNGVFFYGPPGTGKTHLAKALAGELGCNYLELDLADLRTSTFGENVDAVREQFEAARANQPCVVLVDEIDAVAPDRSDDLHQARQEVVNVLLQILAEIGANDEDVLVVGATNKPEEVDDAIKRTGRFDVTVEVGFPDAETRTAILEQELRAFKGECEPVWTDEAFVEEFVTATETFSASDVAEVADAAQRAAVRESDPGETPRVTAEGLLDEVETIADKQERDTASEYVGEIPDIDFDDVGGTDGLTATLRRKVIDPLENPGRFEQYGLDTVNGVLLYGPPGTGKTYVSRALAGETEYTFLSVTASDVASKWVGESAKNISRLFDRARQLQPCILFIDELDAIAQRRGGRLTNTETQAVNEILNALTDIQDEDVVVVATTNRLDMIDPAVKRAGRMDEIIEVPPPDSDARREILQVHLADRPVDEDAIDWGAVADLTAPENNPAPFVAADLAEIADEAARKAMYEADGDEVQPVTQRHLEAAIRAARPSLAGSPR